MRITSTFPRVFVMSVGRWACYETENCIVIYTVFHGLRLKSRAQLFKRQITLICRINRDLADKCKQNLLRHSPDKDLLRGWRYLPLEQPGPIRNSNMTGNGDDRLSYPFASFWWSNYSVFLFFSEIVFKIIALFPNEKPTVRKETYKLKNLINSQGVYFGLKA